MSTLLEGRARRFGDDVNTDYIISSTRKKATLDEHLLKAYLMETVDPSFAASVRGGDIIVAGRNFGCGSHRPGHVLREIGIAAIVVESASRLFLRNSIGLAMPIFVAPGVGRIVGDGETLEVDYPNGLVRNVKTGATTSLRKYPPTIEAIFQCGGMGAFMRRRYLAEMGR